MDTKEAIVGVAIAISVAAVILGIVFAVLTGMKNHGETSQPVIDKEQQVACYYQGPSVQWTCAKYEDLAKL